MSLIKRLATRENQSRHGAPTFRWRRHRLGAVGEFERRFEKVPEVFRNHKLPRMKSYSVHQREYIWPESGEPGKPVSWLRS
jgi:hypothetical protein